VKLAAAPARPLLRGGTQRRAAPKRHEVVADRCRRMRADVRAEGFSAARAHRPVSDLKRAASRRVNPPTYRPYQRRLAAVSVTSTGKAAETAPVSACPPPLFGGRHGAVAKHPAQDR